MAIGGNVSEIFLTGSLAFLAILPASISIIIRHYRSEYRKIGEDWESVKWFRRLIWVMILCLWLAILGYLCSVALLVDIDYNIIGYETLNSFNMMIAAVTTAILFLGVSFTLFTLLFLNRDYPHTNTPRIYFIHHVRNRK